MICKNLARNLNLLWPPPLIINHWVIPQFYDEGLAAWKLNRCKLKPLQIDLITRKRLALADHKGSWIQDKYKASKLTITYPCGRMLDERCSSGQQIMVYSILLNFSSPNS
jgi:hypothetical protein